VRGGDDGADAGFALRNSGEADTLRTKRWQVKQVQRPPPSFRKCSVVSFQLSVTTGGKAKADS